MLKIEEARGLLFYYSSLVFVDCAGAG
jgi:hypothetical protein